jgi:four helix bundle protein
MLSTPSSTDHERLETWQVAMQLLVVAYQVANALPAYERFGMASQVRNAALSIPSNIAEGCGRVGRRDRLHFFTMAFGSLCELRTLFSAAEMVGYATSEQLAVARDLSGQVGRLLNGLRRYERRKN